MQRQKEQPCLMVHNSAHLSHSHQGNRPTGSTLPLIPTHNSHPQPHPRHPRSSSSVEDRLQQLQTNLKYLQKQYRNNLKDGFDKKIKAYRLEAVMERKVLKDALKASQKQKLAGEVKQKLRVSSEKSALFDSRIMVMRNERQRSKQVFLEKKRRDLSTLQESIEEGRAEAGRRAKEMHDKVLEKESHQNRKKQYFDGLRQQAKKNAEQNLKKHLLNSIIGNTTKLRGMKSTLDELMSKQVSPDQTFVTI